MDERAFRTDLVSWGCNTTPAPRPHGGPLHESAYPVARYPGSGLLRLLPSPGLPDVPGPARRLDHLPGTPDHQRGLARYRVGRQAASRHRLRRLPLGRPGVGRPGHRPGDTDPDPSGPRRGVVWMAVDDTLCHKRGAKV